MSLDEIYQQVILDHYSRPRNKGEVAGADVSFEMHNPVCGDRIRVQAALEDGRVAEVRFSGQGCSISQASASMMTQLVKGKDLGEARGLIARFLSMMKGEAGDYRPLGEAQSLQGVSRLPVRIKCATLAWHVLEEGLRRHEAGAAREGEGDRG